MVVDGDPFGAGELSRALDRLAAAVDKLDDIVERIVRHQAVAQVEVANIRRDLDDVRGSLRWAWRTIAGGLVTTVVSVVATMVVWLVTRR